MNQADYSRKICGLVMLLWFLSPLARAAEIQAKDRMVVLISIDGFPAWLWADPTLPIPTLRRLAADGAEAKSMKVSNPAITWINHTTLVTGVEPAKHGVLFNGLLVRQGPGRAPKIEQWAEKSRMVRVPTIYDVAHQAGLTSAQVDWVAVTNSGTINWEFHEIPNPRGEIPLELVGQGVLTQTQLEGYSTNGSSITWRDMVWAKAASHIIKTRKPNLLLFHPLTTDSVNHRYGPGTLASFTAYAYADRLVAELLEALDEAGLKDKATVILTTDHGFKEVKKLILPNVALRQAGLVRGAGPTVGGADAYVMAQGGMAFAYVTDPTKHEELLPRLKGMLGSLEGVDRVVEPKDYSALGMPTPEANDGAGELALFAKTGYAFQSTVVGENVIQDSVVYLGTHGYPNSDPQMDGIFVAWGYGIKAGTKIDRIANLDVAPSIAELLGVKIPNADGRVLRELLK